MHPFFSHARDFLVHWGYLGVAALLLMENTGVPVPGETILVVSSVLAFKSHELRLPWIITVATVACTLGDNIGYWIGDKGGRPLLERWKRFFHVSDDDIRKGEELLKRHGAPAIFFSRFIAGARIIAGPLAGVLRMPWRKFVLFNFLGALTWVSVVAGLSYAFASQIERLLGTIKQAEFAVLVFLIIVLGVYLWRKKKPGSTTTA